MNNEVLGLKAPNRPLCKICRLSTRLMRWSDLNVFGKYRFRIRGCSMMVSVFRTILVLWGNIKMTNEAWGFKPPLVPLVGHGGALVEMMTFNRRVVGSTSAPAAT